MKHLNPKNLLFEKRLKRTAVARANLGLGDITTSPAETTPRAGFGTLVMSRRGPNNIYGTSCVVAVFYNGVRVDGATVDNVSLELLGGIEYYTPGYVPVQYREVSVTGIRGSPSGSAACGVMLLWARG